MDSAKAQSTGKRQSCVAQLSDYVLESPVIFLAHSSSVGPFIFPISSESRHDGFGFRE